ncbi:alpha/beta-hydrolase [Rhizodiscina lignyota]|uniref:Alpha/beta-hydrolase n=1 Tax=Rhizodiscina lignyota TaxID=1504668 RepID=A0A9P4M453_9PEZI|nr:alpha/beta-hydrolase [Rhizodiscina lignyota]
MSCPQCFSGHKNPDTPKGRVEKIHGLSTYIAEPAEGTPVKGIVIIVPDAFGWEFVNNRILADHYASAGDFRVYLPDFMNGCAAPVWMMESMGILTGPGHMLSKPYHLVCTAYSFITFLTLNRGSVTWPRITSFFKAVRENEGASLPIGTAGFCWGGKHVVNLADDAIKPSNSRPLVDAVFTAHPSNLAIPGEIEKVVKPISLAVGDKDFVLNLKGVEDIKKIWAGKPDVDTEVKIYEGAGHGFGARADPNTKEAVRQAGEAETQAVDWFKKQFTKVVY